MTLKQLQIRINEIVQNNERRGNLAANDKEVTIRMKRNIKKPLAGKSRFFTFQFVESGSLTIYGREFGIAINFKEADEIKPTEKDDAIERVGPNQVTA